jgi:hypothetical protein
MEVIWMTSKRMDNYNKCNNTRISQRFGKKSEFAKKLKIRLEVKFLSQWLRLAEIHACTASIPS